MTENDLEDLDFEVQYPADGEGGWYYYTLDIGDICFISNEANAEDEWWVMIFDFESMRIEDKEDAAEMINLVRRNLERNYLLG